MSDDFTDADDLMAWVERGIHEPTAEERIAELKRQVRVDGLRGRLVVGQDELDELDQLDRQQRVRRRNRRLAATGWLVVFAMIAGLVVRSVIRSDAHPKVATTWSSAGRADLGSRAWSGARPTPPAGVSTKPLGTPMAASKQSGPFEFVATQHDSDRPVAYDPCRPIRYVVNHTAQPAGAANLVGDAIKRISEITGLRFVAEGVTDETASDNRESFQPDRYGDAWAPVLIWWADPGTAPQLRGNVAGYAGSANLTITDAIGRPTSVYVTGEVVLDGPQIAEIIRRDPDGERAARAVVLHELGHLVGLGHVNDITELMNPVGIPGVVDYAAGDRVGLRELGLGSCVPGV